MFRQEQYPAISNHRRIAPNGAFMFLLAPGLQSCCPDGTFVAKNEYFKKRVILIYRPS